VGTGHSQGLPEFFWLPFIIPGMGEAMDLRFCKHIYRVDRNKTHEKFGEK